MPEWRRDPIVDRWVVVTPERGRRPSDFRMEGQTRKQDHCPLCSGHEKETPPEVLAYGAPNREPDKPGWRVRVVPNKFPAVQETRPETARQGLYSAMTGLGRHEVVVETPEHVSELDGQGPEQVAEVIRAWGERLEALKHDPRWRYVQVFKNAGHSAGASLEHSHSQIIALPFVPVEIKRELEGMAAHRQAASRCILCDVAAQELADRSRVVYEAEHFLAFTPFASRSPCEVWIVPRRHEPFFAAMEASRRHQLAETYLSVLQGFSLALGAPPYNLFLHSAPFSEPNYADFHWHLEILPRLGTTAGFELGTGYHINPLPPEKAAAALRDAAYLRRDV